MEKINFQNNVTKANAETMNQFQSNIENAINETNTNIPTKTSELENDSIFLTKVSNVLSFSSLDDLRNYLISDSVPIQAVNLFNISLSGQGRGIMVQKTTNSYLSFIMWGYSDICELHRYVNGTWYEKDL